MNETTCPRCHQTVARTHDGSTPINDDRTDPLVFDEHTFDDNRGGFSKVGVCPGSGRNVWVTRNAL